MITKTEANRKALNKPVLVLTRNGFWRGVVIAVKDEETFVVKKNKGGYEILVSMYDIRYEDVEPEGVEDDTQGAIVPVE
jgi:hypothetical protein